MLEGREGEGKKGKGNYDLPNRRLRFPYITPSNYKLNFSGFFENGGISSMTTSTSHFFFLLITPSSTSHFFFLLHTYLGSLSAICIKVSSCSSESEV